MTDPWQDVAEARGDPGRAAAADELRQRPELVATRRPLREAKRQPLTGDCDVRPRDCVPMHGRVRACSSSIGSANGYDRRRLELGSDDGLDGDDWFRR